MRGFIVMAYINGFKGLNVTNRRVEGLMADFSGLVNLEKVVDSVLTRLSKQEASTAMIGMVNAGTISKADFDGWFSELVRKELGRTLGVLRAKAVQKAVEAGAGSAASAVHRRMYKDSYTANINIGGNRKRISNRHRVVPPPDGGKSGIRRPRTVKDRTKKLREYYGPDRDFILRILEEGRDVYMATPEGPTGRRSKATWGKRGSLTPRNWFFHAMKNDMELAAKQLGQTLTGAVETWVNQQFTEANGK